MVGGCLLEAHDIINNERREDYGPVKDSFRSVSDMWSYYLNHTITPKDVAMMMILFKFSREMYSHKLDNLIDMAGYIGCAEKL